MADAHTIRPDAFDALAPTYDADFSDRPVGRLLREAVWARLQPFIRRGMTVLDLGCGTGEDAIWLAKAGCSIISVDGSPVMLRQTRHKAAQCAVDSYIETARYDLDRLPDLGTAFDVVISNFGALNCVAELAWLKKVAVRPGGVVALNVMGRFCAWESLWYGFHLRRAAFRRWRGVSAAVIGGRRIDVRYWSVRDLVAALGPDFRLHSIHGIGIALPPSEVFGFIESRPGLLQFLSRWEARLSLWPSFASLADHRLVIFQRLGSSP